MTRKLGTSSQYVLLWLTSPKRDTPNWNAVDGAAVYESRALTQMACERLVRDGLLDASHTESCIVYTVNQAGKQTARELRLARDGISW